MRASVVTCVSTALDMLEFSTTDIIERAGTEDFDYIIVCWLTSPEVDAYITDLLDRYRGNKVGVIRLDYKTNPHVGYVPNLRGMMNWGFTVGAHMNPYVGLVNTDQAFYHDWLRNLLKNCHPYKVVAAVPIQPYQCAWHVGDFGLTTEDDFNREGFDDMCRSISQERLIREHDLEIWHRATSMPWLIPQSAWWQAGPWELRCHRIPARGPEDVPDVRFFKRIHDLGYEFTVAADSIAYHVGAVERQQRQRPHGAETMPAEA